MYGPGTDWAGKLIERTAGQSLEDYMSSRIWGPLGLSDMTFWPRTKPHMAERVAEMSTWNQDGKCVSLGENFDLNNGATDCLGGSGVFASSQGFLKLLQAVLRADKRLLKKSESWDELFRPQLTPESKEALQRLLEIGDEFNVQLGANVPLGGAKSWSLGGLVSLDGYDGWMREGTMLWSGLPNLRWVSVWGD
jgi:CubicO group peptidase (beta-lactamase class C family)